MREKDLRAQSANGILVREAHPGRARQPETHLQNVKHQPCRVYPIQKLTKETLAIQNEN